MVRAGMRLAAALVSSIIVGTYQESRRDLRGSEIAISQETLGMGVPAPVRPRPQVVAALTATEAQTKASALNSLTENNLSRTHEEDHNLRSISFVQRQSQQDEVDMEHKQSTSQKRSLSKAMSLGKVMSLNFVDEDWSTGCVWGFLMGWVAAVAWVLPVISRGVDHLSLASCLPSWSLGESAEYMSGWAAFWITGWLSQWFMALTYCLLISVLAAVIAVLLGGHLVRKRGTDLGGAVLWSAASSCAFVMCLVAGIVAYSSHVASAGAAPAPSQA